MKKSTVALSALGVLGVVGVAFALTNPNQFAYEEYAAAQLNRYLEEKVCKEAGSLQEQCNSLLLSGQSDLEQVIANTTQRQNFLLFSIYQTELSVPIPFVPSYHVETLGILNNFHIYQTEKR